ncbi:hypothetical protein ANN_14230, partial [Periplaneta americana]
TRIQRRIRKKWNVNPAIPKSIYDWDRTLRDNGSLISKTGKHSKKHVAEMTVDQSDRSPGGILNVMLTGGPSCLIPDRLRSRLRRPSEAADTLGRPPWICQAMVAGGQQQNPLPYRRERGLHLRTLRRERRLTPQTI